MSNLGSNVCYVCLKENLKVRSLSENDEDRMTYKEKLIYCVPNLVGFEDTSICNGCVLLLKGAYKFISMVLSSQGYLKMCNAQLASDDTLAVELKTGSDVIIQNSNNLKKSVEAERACQICNITLKTHSSLKKHLKSVHNDKLECVQIDSELKNIPLVSDRVKTKVPNVRKIKLEFICKVCNTKLKTPAALTRHFNMTHTTNKCHQCKFCQKIFKQSWHLQDHLSSHTGDKSYKCNICDKTFLRISTLRRHFKTHERSPGEKVKPSPFLCNVCGKKFIYSNGMQRHMRVHLGIKEHECEICKRKFSQKTHLLAHLRTHTGEKPYICDTCGEAFTLNASLRKHMDAHKKDLVNVKIEYNGS